MVNSNPRKQIDLSLVTHGLLSKCLSYHERYRVELCFPTHILNNIKSAEDLFFGNIFDRRIVINRVGIYTGLSNWFFYRKYLSND